MSSKTLITLVVVFVILAGAIFFLSKKGNYTPDTTFSSSTLEDKSQGESDDQTPSETTLVGSTGACVPKGCHKELCVDEGVMVKDSCTTDPYQLLVESCTTQYAKCQRQSSGQCGWSQTELYNQCMIEISEK